MSDYVSGVYQVGTITVEASGSHTIHPALSNSPFKNLSITVRPIGVSAAKYDVATQFDGETVETHSYPDATAKIVCNMSYPNKIFPPNLSLKTLPGLRPVTHTVNGLGISVVITNTGAVPITFQVYSTFEEYNSPRTKALDFDALDPKALL